MTCPKCQAPELWSDPADSVTRFQCLTETSRGYVSQSHQCRNAEARLAHDNVRAVKEDIRRVTSTRAPYAPI